MISKTIGFYGKKVISDHAQNYAKNEEKQF